MYNSLGNRARGPSNSIASPGVSSLFGGVTTSTGKPAEAQSNLTGAGVQPAPFRPQTAQATMSRYTPTYASNAFGHADYSAPLHTTESAASRALQSTGTSIEDYGRRNAKWDKNVFVRAHDAVEKAAGVQFTKREIVHVDHADCSNCANHQMISQKKNQVQSERNTILTAEQQRFAAIRAQEEQERLRAKAERDLNKGEMNSTLYQINAQKQAEWDAKKNDRTNYEQTQKLQSEIKDLTWKSIHDKVQTQAQYKSELNRKREEAIQANVNGKINDRELERRLKGLQFECYERDPLMKEETKKTGGFVKTQIEDWQSRKAQEKEEMVKPPEVFYTDKELAQLRAEAEARDREMRQHNSKYAQDQLGQHYSKLTSAQLEKQRQVAEENDHLNRLKRLQEQDNLNQRRTREERKNEWTSTLNHIDQKKRADWDAKKTDQTNKIQTLQLQNDISQLTQNSLFEQWKQKVEYNKDLSHLTVAQRQSLEQERQNAREAEAKAKGLTFECYTRDPLMKEASKETGQYLKSQTELEALRKQQERQEIIRPPPSLVTTEHLTQMQREAMENENQRRFGLKSLMESQYHETLAQRNARIAAEKARDAEQAALTAARNAEITRAEKQYAQATKEDYDGYLRYQLSDAEQRRLQEIAERKYDPNTERLIQENARIGEKIIKCGTCESTLAHEKTIFQGSSNGHTH